MNPLDAPASPAHPTPPAHITLWWLGQAGFMIKSPGGQSGRAGPVPDQLLQGDRRAAWLRLRPPGPAALARREFAQADAWLFTHSHQDHCDPETLAAARRAGGHGPYVAPPETIEKLCAFGVPATERS